MRVITYLILCACFTVACRPEQTSITCNTEIVSASYKEYLLSKEGDLLIGAKFRTKEESRSGDYSLKLSNENPYGYTVKLKDLKDKILNVSVWKKGKGEIIVASDKTRVFYESFRQIVAQSDGWEKLVASFAFPDNIGDDELKIYVYHTNNSPSYFDDFEINISDK